jgi:hypothetical protein
MPRNYEVRELAGQEGHYYHFGIASGVETFANSENLPAELKLQFNLDGLPLFKSSSLELWPILYLVRDASVAPLVVGLYCGQNRGQPKVERGPRR